MTVRVSVDLPEDTFSALRTTPEDFVQEMMRLADAVKWYELGVLLLAMNTHRLYWIASGMVKSGTRTSVC